MRVANAHAYLSFKPVSSPAQFCFCLQSVFDELDGEEMRRARTRSNPYEMIRGVFFLNRFAKLLVA